MAAVVMTLSRSNQQTLKREARKELQTNEAFKMFCALHVQ